MKAPLYTFNSDIKSSIALPASVFEAPVNEVLMAQVVRVYLANQRQGNAHTKGRSDVTGSTRKVYRQKGTGNARHGDIKAPVFVGGGIVHGPVAHPFTMSIPVKMKRAALRSALSSLAEKVVVVAGLGGVDGKTKNVVDGLDAVTEGGTKVLVVLGDAMDRAQQALRNNSEYDYMYVMDLNTYSVLNHDMLVIAEEAVPLLAAWLGRESDE